MVLCSPISFPNGDWYFVGAPISQVPRIYIQWDLIQPMIVSVVREHPAEGTLLRATVSSRLLSGLGPRWLQALVDGSVSLGCVRPKFYNAIFSQSVRFWIGPLYRESFTDNTDTLSVYGFQQSKGYVLAPVETSRICLDSISFLTAKLGIVCLIFCHTAYPRSVTIKSSNPSITLQLLWDKWSCKALAVCSSKEGENRK